MPNPDELNALETVLTGLSGPSDLRRCAPQHPLVARAYAEARARKREREHRLFQADVAAVVAAFLLDGVDVEFELERMAAGL